MGKASDFLVDTDTAEEVVNEMVRIFLCDDYFAYSRLDSRASSACQVSAVDNGRDQSYIT